MITKVTLLQLNKWCQLSKHREDLMNVGIQDSKGTIEQEKWLKASILRHQINRVIIKLFTHTLFFGTPMKSLVRKEAFN